jgi:hypothetical protein
MKVKDAFAGKTVLCPTCQAKTKIPRAATASAAVPATTATPGLPTARLLKLSADAIAGLPQALPYGQSPPLQPAPAFDPPQEPAAFVEAPAPAMPAAALLHPVLAERPDLLWCIAFPGGDPSEPVSAESMQAWLDGRQAEGTEVIWRSDWSDWLSVRDVFPEYFA